VSARRTIRVRRAVSLRVGARQRHQGRAAIDLRVAGGRLSGWWLAESPGRVYLRGFAAPVGYDPVRRLTIADGVRLTAFTFKTNGAVLESVRVDTSDGLTLSVDRRAIVDGLDRVRVSGGELDGYWLRLVRGVVLR